MGVQLWRLQGFINPINNVNLNQTESLGNTLQELFFHLPDDVRGPG